MFNMKIKHVIGLVVLLSVAGLVLASIPAVRAGNDIPAPGLPSLHDSLQAPSGNMVIIDFNGVPPGDYATYSEDGFTLTPSEGSVRINNHFPPNSNAAQPSFGFGNGVHDDSFTFTSNSNLPFDAVSIELLEANETPTTYGVTIIGTKADLSTVTQTFTLDGIAGTQTFAFSPAFTGLVSLKIAEDSSNAFILDAVQIDNVLLALPVPPDADGDGVADDADQCPNSDVSATVVIDGCNSGVTNTLFPSGCKISDLIAACATGAGNHGEFVACVSSVTNDLKKAGTITGQQKDAIQSCAERAAIP